MTTTIGTEPLQRREPGGLVGLVFEGQLGRRPRYLRLDAWRGG